MHPKQLEFLSKNEQQARMMLHLLQQKLEIVRQPRRYGMLGSLGAAAAVPTDLVTLGLLRITRLMYLRMGADKWDIIASGRSDQPPPEEEL